MPESIKMTAQFLGHGNGGYAVHTYANEEFGVLSVAVRENRHSDFKVAMTCIHIGPREFTTFAAMRAAYNALSWRDV